MIDICTIGELLIDFSQTPNRTFVPNPGGAPGNVICMASKMGKKTSIISKIGTDTFGEIITNCLAENDVDTSLIVRSKDRPTTLAFVSLDKNGERSFSFYRDLCADVSIQYNEIDWQRFSGCKIFHFGSVSLTDEPSRTATIKSVLYAKEHGSIISFDPNYRPLLWKDKDEALKEIRKAAELADIIKVSEDEMFFMTNTESIVDGANAILEMGAKLVFVTRGEKGSYTATKDYSFYSEPYIAKAVDTTGAGDSFFGTVLACICGYPDICSISEKEMRSMSDMGNAAASITVEGKGAIPALPSIHAIHKRQKQGKKMLNLN